MKQTLILSLILISFCGSLFAAKIMSPTAYSIEQEEGLDWGVFCIAFSNNAAWIGTELGLMGSYLSSPHITSMLDSKNSDLPGDIINVLAEKEPGIFWVATDAGLAILDPINYAATIPEQSPLVGKSILSLAVDQKGVLWVSSFIVDDRGWPVGAGLSSYDGNSWQSFTTANSTLPKEWIRSIVVGADNTKWLGTDSKHLDKDPTGICSYDGQSFTTHGPTEYPTSVTCLAIDATGKLWMGLDAYEEGRWRGKGLSTFDGENWTHYNTENSEIPGNYISDITIAKDGAIWIVVSETDSVYPVGLARFDGKEWLLIKQNHVANKDERINTISIDPMGKLWVGKSSGLAVISFTE